jgi:hypothetical protein
VLLSGISLSLRAMMPDMFSDPVSKTAMLNISVFFAV